MTRKKNIITFILLITATSVLISLGIVDLSNNRKKNHSSIKQIALVYRYSNYAFCATDYLYVIREDGVVFFENLIQNADKYDNYKDDLLPITLTIFDDMTKVGFRFDVFPDALKDELYSVNYDSISLKFRNDAMDGGSECYYCLIQLEDKYKLVKIREKGMRISKSTNGNLNNICNYIDDICKEIEDVN